MLSVQPEGCDVHTPCWVDVLKSASVTNFSSLKLLVSAWHAGKLFSPSSFCFLAGKVKVISSKITHLKFAKMLVIVIVFIHLSIKQVHWAYSEV